MKLNNICRGRALRIAVGITMLVLFIAGGAMALAVDDSSGAAHARMQDVLQMPGRLEANGTHFEVNNSEYLNITLDSSEPIKLVLESIPEMVTMHIEAARGAASAQITLGGFAPQTTYHKYENDYHNHTAFITDANGSYTYTQDISKPHLVFIQPRASTKFINDNTTGGDCTLIGVWDAAAKICTLTVDLTETVQIDSNGITLDGNGYKITGSNTGNGVYLSGRNVVTIKNLNIKQFSNGVYLYISSNNTLSNNNASNNNGNGIYLDYSSNNTLSSNIASNNDGGIYLDYSSNNTLINNSMTGNRYNFNLGPRYGYHVDSDFDNIIDTSNTVDGKPILYIKNGKNIVYSSSSNAGTIYCIWCNNITIKNITLIKNGYGIFFWNTKNSKVENITVSNNGIGISLWYSSNNTLSNNNVSNNYWDGIYLEQSNNNTLSGNNVNLNTRHHFLDIFHEGGIYLDESSNNTLTTNNISNNLWYGIGLDYSSNNMLSSNIVNSNVKTGIYLDNSINNNLTGNTANFNGGDGFRFDGNYNNLISNTANNNSGSGFGFDSNYNNLTDNTANFNGGNGIYLYSGANILTGNTANSNGGNGIYLWTSINSNLIGNTANSNNWNGIRLDASRYNTLIDNTANSNNWDGILIAIRTVADLLSNNNKLSGNIANFNGGDGIELYVSSNNTLIGNNASNNDIGILLSSSSNNTIYNNYFNNTGNAWDNGYNYWNITKQPGKNIINGSYLGGNYWSDYFGNDTDGDGLGNTLLPYNSSGRITNGGDYLPLKYANGCIGCVPFPGMSALPTDPDGDGLYEDTNGNGRKDFSDVVLFFNYLEWVPGNEPIASFDFNRNGRIDFDDIIKLFERI